ncbi:glycosyl hydrolase family 28-related protein [Jeotgalibaca porci]|uniref:glycosyl hydrolase family 28-related protein n=1 Tax=Jeotgalibaca porci TaxID=1868793 RepID=UPI00359F74E6
MAINPKIKQKAEDIRSKIFGSEVRESLASGIEAISEDVEATIGRQDYVEEQFQDVLDETTGKDVISAPELIAARNGKSNLKTRLDGEHAQVTAQLQQNEVLIADVESNANNRIDSIIARPAEGISEQEIWDARHGNSSLGTNLLGVKQEINNLSSNLMKAATNLIDNIDSSKWADGGSNTVSIGKSGSTLIATGTGVNANAHIKQSIPMINIPQKYYIKTRFLVESAKCQVVSFLLPNATKDFANITNTSSTAEKFTVGQWKDVSLVVDKNVNVDSFSIIARHASAADAKDSVVKVEPIVIINITSLFGQGNEWNAVAMNNLLLKNNRTTFEKNARLNPRRVERFAFIKDFGAVGDGVTDDTEAILRALDYGGFIIVTSGTYLVSGTMRIRDNTKFICNADNVKFKLAGTYSLSPYAWRQDYLDYYPIFVTPRGTKNVEIHGLELEGSDTFTDHIQVGLAIETAEDVLIKNCKVNKINYHPGQAPPRPSGQFRTGWNIAIFRSKNVEVANTEAFYGGYECIRVGDLCDGVKIHHSKFGYGWRTVFQILKGSKNIEFSDNDVVQDDFDTNDTHASLTFHSTADDPIDNVRILRNNIKAKLYLENPSGPFAISCVDNYSRNFTFEDNTIESNGYLIGFNGGGTLELIRNKGKAQDTGFAINNHGLRKLVIEDNDIDTTQKSCVLINSLTTVLRRVRIKDNDFKTASTNNAVTFGGTADILSPLISGNAVEQSGNAVYLSPNVKKAIVAHNDFSGASGYYSSDPDNIFDKNIIN